MHRRHQACLFTDTWDCTWRNRPCAKLPPPTARESSDPHTQKFPPNLIQPPFGQLANNIPPTPLPRPHPLHSLRQSGTPRRADTSAPRFVEGTHGDPLAPTVHSRRLSSSSCAATAGDVLVEAHDGQRRHRWRRSCGGARRSAPPPLATFVWRRTMVSFSHGTRILD